MTELQVISRADARALGLKRYVTGKPCKNGHVAERLVCNNSCSECEADRANDPGNRAKHRASSAEWHRRKHASDPEYRAKRTAHAADWQRRRYASDPEYRAAKQARVAAWRRDNPEAWRNYVHRRRARKRGNGVGEFTNEDRELLWELQGGLCNNQLCNAELWEVGCDEDHITPLKDGGLHDFANMQLLCPACNRKKGAKPWSVFLSRYFEEVTLAAF